MKQDKYFLRYCPDEKKVDYTLLFALYDIAEYNKTEKVNNLIYYGSQPLLADRLQISINIVRNIFTVKEYEYFLDIDKKKKVIRIRNKIERGDKKARFVLITKSERELIDKINQRKFERYLVYTKYYCGYTHNNTDFTAKQFLREFGYSELQVNDCMNYNKILKDNGLIQIETYTDELGHKRNRYIYPTAIYEKLK